MALRLRLLFNLVAAMSRFNSRACVRVLSVCCCLVAASGSESILFAMCRLVVVLCVCRSSLIVAYSVRLRGRESPFRIFVLAG